jgi:RNA polymerase sigma-70 factor, ECF subfamily
MIGGELMASHGTNANLPVPIAPKAGEAALTDEMVVARVRAGETALYEILMRRHNRTVYRAVRALLRDEDEVEDVMQQAYLSAYAKLDRFSGEARFSTWLVSIALNEARDRLRRRSVRAVAAAAHEVEPQAPPPTPEDQVNEHELARLLERAVDELPTDYRAVFVLRTIEGMATADAAAALGVSEDVVKTRLHRARAQLRDALAETMDRAAPAAFEFLAPRCDRVVAGVLAHLLPPPAPSGAA